MLGAGRFAADGVRSGARRRDLARLGQLFLIPLLSNEEADPGGDLADAVANGQAEGINLENDFLELGQCFCHSEQMIPRRQPNVQTPWA